MISPTKRQSIARTGTAVLLVALLSSCSSGGDVDGFCKEIDEIVAVTEGVDLADQAAVDAMNEDLEEHLGDIDPPSDIKDAWKTTVDINEEIADAMEDIDFQAEDAGEKVAAASAPREAEEFKNADEKVSAFIEENCEA